MQSGTQFDGFTHQALDRLLYNCVKMDEVASRSGFTKMGMEKVGTLMTRGVLIDIAGLKGVETLPINYEITVADLEQALQKQGIRLEPGDAVLIYTGWSKHWGVDKMNAVGLNADGQQAVYTAWEKPIGAAK